MSAMGTTLPPKRALAQVAVRTRHSRPAGAWELLVDVSEHERRFLSALALIVVIAAATVGMVLLPHWVSPRAPLTTYTFQAASAVLGCSALVYLLNRAGYYRVAAPLFVAVLLLAPAWAARDRPEMLVFLFVGMLAGTLVLTVRGALAAGVLGLAAHAVILLDPQRTLRDLAFPFSVNALQVALVLAVREAQRRLERSRYDALMESEKWFATALSSIGDAVLTADTRGKVSFMNPVAAELTGWSFQEAQGRDVAEVFKIESELTGEPVQSPVERVLREGKVVGLANHTALIAKDGSRRPIADSGAPLFVEDELIGAVLVFRDMSREREFNERLESSSRLESLGRLAGGVAHDFNNLLTVINGGLGLALGQLRSDDPLRTDLEDVLSATERAVGLTRQLLAFSRRQVLQPQALDLNRAVMGAARILRRMLPPKVTLHTALVTDATPVMVDPVQLEQVITNLAINGADAMVEGGQLTLRTSLVHVAADDAKGLAQGNYVQLSVVDEGVGMDKKTRDRAFEPFFSTKPPGRGTGLGLATVHGIVQQSGGSIEIDSELGKGTTFTVWLPCCQPRDSVDHVRVSKPKVTPTGAEQTILLVEDDPQVRKFAARVLDSMGYKTLTAGSGAEALRVALEHEGEIQLLITDIVMPQMTGPQVADALRAQDPALPVLFVSGCADEVVARDGVAQQDGMFLAKPFTPSALAAKVSAVLTKTESDLP